MRKILTLLLVLGLLLLIGVRGMGHFWPRASICLSDILFHHHQSTDGSITPLVNLPVNSCWTTGPNNGDLR